MLLRAFLFFAFIFGVEWYAFQALTTVFGSGSLISTLYFSATGLIFLSILLYFNFSLRERLRIPRQLLMAIFFLLFIPKIFILPFMLTEDVVRLLKLGIDAAGGPDLGTGRSVLWDSIALIFSGGISLAFIYGALFNVYNYKVRKVPITLMDLPGSFNGLKVVQISDIHSGSLSDIKAVQKAVDRINALQPDLIFFTGDLVNNIAAEAVQFVDVFARLRAKHGVYSILGNHDYGDYMMWNDPSDKVKNLDTLKELHARMGWKLLLNEHIYIERDGEKIAVAGVENWSARGRFHSYGKLNEALQGIQDSLTVLLLSHDPSHWEAEILEHPTRVDITFSGHTHGMQFGMELFRFKWSPVQYLYKQWAGLYRNKEKYLYVNRGFGVIGYPGRVGILPEITLFTLYSAQDAASE
ncbi:MAG: metallophosphoesterase [Chitinophagales bacterium]